MRNSLKPVAITFALIVAMSCWMSAQTYGTEPQHQGQGQMADQQRMHALSAQERLDWLSQQLNLTDDQKTKLLPVLQTEEQQIKAVHDNSSLSQDQMRDKIKQIHQANRPQIEAVLTPEQKQKLAQLKEEKSKGRHSDKMGTPGQDESHPKDK